jgi:hypothetical protein
MYCGHDWWVDDSQELPKPRFSQPAHDEEGYIVQLQILFAEVCSDLPPFDVI